MIIEIIKLLRGEINIHNHNKSHNSRINKGNLQQQIVQDLKIMLLKLLINIVVCLVKMQVKILLVYYHLRKDVMHNPFLMVQVVVVMVMIHLFRWHQELLPIQSMLIQSIAMMMMMMMMRVVEVLLLQTTRTRTKEARKFFMMI